MQDKSIGALNQVYLRMGLSELGPVSAFCSPTFIFLLPL